LDDIEGHWQLLDLGSAILVTAGFFAIVIAIHGFGV